MQNHQRRLDSFSKAVRVKNSSLTSSVKWPHPSSFVATPSKLADAGFYFDPSWEDRDNVTCFMCGKELADWASSDDPFEIHWSKCKATCVWAVVKCGLRDDVDEDGRCVVLSTWMIENNSWILDMSLRTGRVCRLGKRWRRRVWQLSPRRDRGPTMRSKTTAPALKRCFTNIPFFSFCTHTQYRWRRQGSCIHP